MRFSNSPPLTNHQQLFCKSQISVAWPLYCSKSRYGSVVWPRGSSARARQDPFVHFRARPRGAPRRTGDLRTGQPLVNMQEKETPPDRRETWVPPQSCRCEIPTDRSSAPLVSRATSRIRSELKKNLRRSHENCAKRMKPLSSIWKWLEELQQAMLPHRYPRSPDRSSKAESTIRFYPFTSPQ